MVLTFRATVTYSDRKRTASEEEDIRPRRVKILGSAGHMHQRVPAAPATSGCGRAQTWAGDHPTRPPFVRPVGGAEEIHHGTLASVTTATLDRPIYGMGQAARLLGLRTDTLRQWIDGYERAGVTYPPVLREEHTRNDLITWGEFVEAGYLREYRAKPVTLQYLRPLISILREELGVRYPLATLQPYTSGRTLALKVQKQVGLDPSLNIVVLGRDGSPQLTDPAVAFLKKVDFAPDGSRDARRLYPLGRTVPVVLDPEHSFGEPTLSNGARTEVVAELIDAGEPRDRVAAFYDISLDDVDAAVTYERDHTPHQAA